MSTCHKGLVGTLNSVQMLSGADRLTEHWFGGISWLVDEVIWSRTRLNLGNVPTRILHLTIKNLGPWTLHLDNIKFTQHTVSSPNNIATHKHVESTSFKDLLASAS